MHEFDGLPIHERPVVLFDFDGTVADTQPAIMRAVGTVLSNHGYELSEEQMLPLIGPPLEIGIKLVTDMGEQEAQVVAAEYRALFERTVTPADIPLFPHTADLRCAGGPWRLLWRRRARGADALPILGVTQFEAVAGRIPGFRETKAESIAAALDALGATSADAVMVGDRMYDVRGAAELGIPCIGIYSGAAVPGELEEAGAVAACKDMLEVGRVLGVW
ncbi:MAG: HAD hydrolase-like protein [Collinsella intestinalis]